jgi:hypothetical protein
MVIPIISPSNPKIKKDKLEISNVARKLITFITTILFSKRVDEYNEEKLAVQLIKKITRMNTLRYGTKFM